MKKIKRNDDDDGGLDSLLDTMTNVVGILVLVLIVTQLGVSDALTEITANSKVTEEDLESVREQMTALAQEKEDLTEQTTSLAAFDMDAERERLKRLREMLETRKKLLADQSKEANEFALAIERDQRTAAKNQQAIKDTKEQRQKLQSTIEKSLERRAEVQALLARVRSRACRRPTNANDAKNPPQTAKGC